MSEAAIGLYLPAIDDSETGGARGPRRDGLNLYYRVVKPEVFAVLDSLNLATDITPKLPEHKHKTAECPCPKCNIKAGTTFVQVAEL